MPHPAQPHGAAAALASGHLGDLPARRGHGPHRLARFWEPTRSADGSLCRYRRDAVGSASQPTARLRRVTGDRDWLLLTG
jgi:hypothetical protein